MTDTTVFISIYSELLTTSPVFSVNTILWKSHWRENHSCIYIGLPVEKNKSLSFLHVFFLSLLVEASYSFFICIFIFSCTPQMCCSLPRLPLHSRKKYMIVLNKCSIHSYSAALVWIHSYSSPAPSQTIILFRKKSYSITTGIKRKPRILYKNFLKT